MKSKFKRINSFEIRHQLFLNIKDRYPNKIYVIFEKGEELFNSQAPDIGTLQKEKCIFQKENTHLSLHQLVKSRLKLGPERSLCLLIGKTILSWDTTQIGETYNKFKDEDGFLYITYVGHPDFG